MNTRVGIPAVYLPAYGAISFLPYSLRPIFAWVSSLLLSDRKRTKKNSNRHDKLLFPVLLLASLTFIGTTFIPSSEGIILCFIWGFVRGIAEAWNDFLLGMVVIELSEREATLLISPCDDNEGNTNYDHAVSVNTAQSSTANNIGSFVASIATFLFFSKNKHLGNSVANTLLVGTAAIFLLASLVSLKYQFSIGNSFSNNTLLNSSTTTHHYDTIDNNDEGGVVENTSIPAKDDMGHTSSSSFQQQPSPPGLDQPEPATNDDELEPTTKHQQQIMEVSSLVAFQTLLAVSALRKPIILISNQNLWLSLVVTLATILIFISFLGCRYQHQQRSISSDNEGNDGRRSRRHRIPHRQLNLYFLLRYSMPIASYLGYSYYYTVFESEPMFLQFLSILRTAIGIVATYFYEKFFSPHFHSGWPMMKLIASLDILMGLVALLDVWVIRAINKTEVFGDDNAFGGYSIDTSLRCLVAGVGMLKYFLAELDYMPAKILSATNIDSDYEKRLGPGDDGKIRTPEVGNNIECITSQVEKENASLSGQNVSSLNIDMCREEEDDASTQLDSYPIAGPASVYSAGMQYATFLSCIDFGAQIGDWITVPIVAALGITRENHWEGLDKFVIVCSICRMGRVVFLWLICPPIPAKKSSAGNNQYNNQYNNVMID